MSKSRSGYDRGNTVVEGPNKDEVVVTVSTLDVVGKDSRVSNKYKLAPALWLKEVTFGLALALAGMFRERAKGQGISSYYRWSQRTSQNFWLVL